MRLFEVEQPDIYNIKQKIEKDCKPFLDQVGDMHHYALYRGMLKKDQILELTVRQDRLPVTMNKQNHDVLVKVFKEAGYKANRNNSVFCTGNYQTAKEYGNVYQIFPIGDFSFTWNENVKDLFEWIYDHGFPERVDAFVKSYHNNKYLKEAIENGNEIMIACEKYYAVHYNLTGEIL